MIFKIRVEKGAFFFNIGDKDSVVKNRGNNRGVVFIEKAFETSPVFFA